MIHEGNLVNAGQQTGIVSIAQLQPIAVVFAEPQEYVTRINEKLAAGSPEVTVMDAEGHTLATGRLSISDNQVDLPTGTIRLKAEFDNKDNALWPGLAVTTGLQLGVEKDVSRLSPLKWCNMAKMGSSFLSSTTRIVRRCAK